ncbi:oncostatin-M-specific receptor subunit beta isoform X2 [Tenrec ecaudatus]|uniref:oncostatin-M-specific receptor subunit beta isoform X2 n=1 Tax=Tenrec ecaudatus TaxID=94439 RepID=UPI003F597C42
MAASALCQSVFLLVSLLLGTCQLKGLSEPLSVSPGSLKFAIDSTYQSFSLLWSVHGLLDHQEIQMNFQIQISRINKSNAIWKGDYITTVKSNAPVHWSWESELPLECATHFVRIRSHVDDARFPQLRSWSKWTAWKEIRVLNPLSPGKNFSLFPKDNLVEAGSNMTVCYVSRSNGSEIDCFLENERIHGEALTPHVTAFILINVPFLRPTGMNMHCRENSTNELKDGLVIYVSKMLEDPKNFSCETQDLKTVNCTWDPVAVTAPVKLHPSNKVQPPESYALHESFSQETKVCEHNTWCTWQVAEDSQDGYNFTLQIQNIFRKRSVNLAFNLTHRVHPRPPFNFFLENMNSTSALVSWKVQPLRKSSTFLCQVECLHDEHVMEQVNISVGMHGECLLSGLEPDTQYLARVRCAYGNHLWKWSDWVGQRFTTLDVAPSAPDVWRTVDSVPGGYNVTLHWKLPPKDRAWRKVLFYNITVENLDEASTPNLLSVPPTLRDAAVTLGSSTHRISVTATSRGGTSPASAVVIAGGSADDEEVEEKRVMGTADGVFLSWKPRSGDAEGYVVEWYEQALGPLHGLQWKKLGPKSTHTVISPDAFRPGIRYNFRIYELSTKLMASLLEKKTGYYQELVPLVNPQVTVDQLNAHSFTLSWKDYSTESQHGFIRGYYVYLKSKMQHCAQVDKRVTLPDNSSYCKYEINDPEQKTFMAEHLQPKSTYEFFVTAFTSAGKGPNGTFTEITTADEYDQMLLRVLLPMGFCVTLIMVIFYMKIQWMKRHCYPDIPDPYKSSILSLIKSKSSNLTILSPQDCTPDAIEVVDRLEGSKTQPTQKSDTKMELPLSASPQPFAFADQNPSDGRACICFENLTYNQQVPDPCSCDHSPVPPTTPPHHLGLFSSLENIWKDYMTSLDEVPAGETGVNYVSQLTSPVSGGKDSLPTDPLVAAQCSEYKIQMVVPLGAPLSPHTEDCSLCPSAP